MNRNMKLQPIQPDSASFVRVEDGESPFYREWLSYDGPFPTRDFTGSLVQPINRVNKSTGMTSRKKFQENGLPRQMKSILVSPLETAASSSLREQKIRTRLGGLNFEAWLSMRSHQFVIGIGFGRKFYDRLSPITNR